MKFVPFYRNLIIAACICLLSGINISTTAQPIYKIKSHKMTVSGTSSLHDWTSDVNRLEFTGQIDVQGNQVKSVKDIVVMLPVISIKSTHGDKMDSKTYEAFKHDKNPLILFRLNSSTITNGIITGTGTLTMAGSAKPITMKINSKVLANGDVEFTGSYSINMKNHNMTPPKAVMGTIKVGETVTVKYQLIVVRKK